MSAFGRALRCTLALAGVGCERAAVADAVASAPLGIVRMATPPGTSPLSTVHQLAIHAPSGTVYVVHGDRTEIPMFDSLGHSVGTIGRLGSGPGEFRGLTAIGFLGDTLWTIDSELRRLSMFDPRGTLLSSRAYTPIPPTFGQGAPAFFAYPLMLLADGTMLGTGGSTARDVASGAAAVRPHLRLTANADTRDTIAWSPQGRGTLALRSSSVEMFLGQPFSDETLYAYGTSPARVILVDRAASERGDSATIRITAIDVDGDTAFARDVWYTPLPLPRDTIAQARERILKAYGRAYGITEGTLDAALITPAFRTPVSAVVAGTDGSVWLRREEAADSTDYLVLDRTGTVSARWRTDTRTRVLWANVALVWGVTLDEDDVPTVVRLGAVQSPR